MAGNFFDQFDAPAAPKGGNFFDQFDAHAQAPAAPQPQEERPGFLERLGKGLLGSAANSTLLGNLAQLGAKGGMAAPDQTPPGGDAIVHPDLRAFDKNIAMPPAQGIGEHLTDLLSGVLGGTASPEGMVGPTFAKEGAGVVANTLRSAAGQGVVMGGLNPVTQGARMLSGAQDKFEPEQIPESIATGALGGGILHLGAEAVPFMARLAGKLGKAPETVTPQDVHAAAAQGDPDAHAILQSAGVTPEQAAAMSPEFQQQAEARILARQQADQARSPLQQQAGVEGGVRPGEGAPADRTPEALEAGRQRNIYDLIADGKMDPAHDPNVGRQPDQGAIALQQRPLEPGEQRPQFAPEVTQAPAPSVRPSDVGAMEGINAARGGRQLVPVDNGEGARLTPEQVDEMARQSRQQDVARQARAPQQRGQAEADLTQPQPQGGFTDQAARAEMVRRGYDRELVASLTPEQVARASRRIGGEGPSTAPPMEARAPVGQQPGIEPSGLFRPADLTDAHHAAAGDEADISRGGRQAPPATDRVTGGTGDRPYIADNSDPNAEFWRKRAETQADDLRRAATGGAEPPTETPGWLGGEHARAEAEITHAEGVAGGHPEGRDTQDTIAHGSPGRPEQSVDASADGHQPALEAHAAPGSERTPERTPPPALDENVEPHQELGGTPERTPERTPELEHVRSVADQSGVTLDPATEQRAAEHVADGAEPHEAVQRAVHEDAARVDIEAAEHAAGTHTPEPAERIGPEAEPGPERDGGPDGPAREQPQPADRAQAAGAPGEPQPAGHAEEPAPEPADEWRPKGDNRADREARAEAIAKDDRYLKGWFQADGSEGLKEKIDGWISGGDAPNRVHGDVNGRPIAGKRLENPRDVAQLSNRGRALAKKLGQTISLVTHSDERGAPTHGYFVETPPNAHPGTGNITSNFNFRDWVGGDVTHTFDPPEPKTRPSPATIGPKPAPKPNGAGTTLYSNPLGPVARFLFGDAKEWRDNAHDARAIREEVKGLEKPAGEGVVKHLARMAFETEHGHLRELGKTYKSGEWARQLDMLHDTAATGRAAGRTLEEGIRLRVAKAANDLDHILMFAKEKKLVDAQVIKQVKRPGSRSGDTGKAAEMIAGWLKEHEKYLTSAGVDMGHVRNYFPHAWDVNKLRRDKAGFLAAAAEAYLKDGIATSQKEADGMALGLWHSQVFGEVPTPGTHVGAGQGAPFKERVFSPRVDDLLDPYRNQNVGAGLVTYARQSARRGEVARRWGDNFQGDAKRGVPSWKETVRKLEKEGASQGVEQLQTAIEHAAGIPSSRIDPRARTALSWARTITTLSLLEKAVFSSLGEPFMVASQTGDFTSGFRAMKDTMSQLLRTSSGDPEKLRVLAQHLGIVAGEHYRGMLAARYSGGDATSRAQSAILSQFFRGTGLEQYTAASDVAAMRGGLIYLSRLSHELTQGGKAAKDAGFFLRDLGVPEKDHAAFGKLVDGLVQRDAKLGGLIQSIKVPQAADVTAAGPLGDHLTTALQRFVGRTVQRPTAMTRPAWANHPYGAVLFQLQAFNYAYHGNVLNRIPNTFRAVNSGELSAGMGTRMLAAQALGGMVPALALMAAVGEVRSKLYDSPETRARMSTSAKVERALSQAGFFGAADPLIQWFGASRYNSGIIDRAVGPLLGQWAKTADAIKDMAVGQPKNGDSRSVTRNFVGTMYETLMEPALQSLLTRAPPSLVNLATRTVLIPTLKKRAMDLAGPPSRQGTQPIQGGITGSVMNFWHHYVSEHGGTHRSGAFR